MAESLLGLYKLEKHENFEKFMEAIGKKLLKLMLAIFPPQHPQD